MQIIAEVKSVSKSYGLSQVINHCSFNLYEGEIYALLGINGAGKTTVMKMILGLQRTDERAIYVMGKELNGLDPIAITEMRELLRKLADSGIWGSF